MMNSPDSGSFSSSLQFLFPVQVTINLNRRVVFILCLGLGVYGTLYLLETGILDEILVPSDEQYMSQALRDIENVMSEKNKKEH